MKREGLSPDEAAKRIGCDRSTLVRILPGRDGSKPKRRPGWDLLRKIAAGTNGEVTANDFMDDGSEGGEFSENDVHEEKLSHTDQISEGAA